MFVFAADMLHIKFWFVYLNVIEYTLNSSFQLTTDLLSHTI